MSAKCGGLAANRELTWGEWIAICGRIANIEKRPMLEAPALIGTCLNCIAPGRLGATLGLVLFGLLFVVHTERRKLTTEPVPVRSK